MSSGNMYRLPLIARIGAGLLFALSKMVGGLPWPVAQGK